MDHRGGKQKRDAVKLVVCIGEGRGGRGGGEGGSPGRNHKKPFCCSWGPSVQVIGCQSCWGTSWAIFNIIPKKISRYPLHPENKTLTLSPRP